MHRLGRQGRFSFRTVESLPILVKTWYNDDCPRFLRQKLSTFVENTVAPATMQRELVRIKDATSFGEMTVRGSTVSREIIATYQQDEVRDEHFRPCPRLDFAT